jgi:ferredoxin
MKLMTMRIVVDLNRCQGYGQCVFLAPGVFELHGEEDLMYDPGPDEEQLIPVVRRCGMPRSGNPRRKAG